MEAFTLLKYWRTSGCTGGGTAALFTGDSIFNTRPTTKSALNPAAATPYFDYGFDGPYFDLEFTLTGDNKETVETSETTETESGSDAEHLSENEYEEDEKDGEQKFSLTKFRVLLLKLKKSNSSNGLLEKSEKSEKNDERGNQGRVSDNAEEVKGPLVSLFAREKANHREELKHSIQDSDRNSFSDYRNLGKDVLQKYLNMLKPLYVGVSSRYVEKMKFSGQVMYPAGSPKCGGAVSPPCTAAEKGCEVPKWRSSVKVPHNNLQAGLKVMRKHLGKSRSTSTVAAVSPPEKMGSNRRDDLELQEGIQGAILHCKKSFNFNREGESAVFSRSAL